MCTDDDVMRYFYKKLNADEATAFMKSLKDAIETRVLGFICRRTERHR